MRTVQWFGMAGGAVVSERRKETTFDDCGDPYCERCKRLRWMACMEAAEREVFPDSRPRSEVIVEVPRG